jgi:hypothetical protein
MLLLMLFATANNRLPQLEHPAETGTPATDMDSKSKLSSVIVA